MKNHEVTNSEIAEFVSGSYSEENEDVLARRVLAAALREPDMEEKLFFLRGVEVAWEQSMASSGGGVEMQAAPDMVALQEILRRATQTAAGFDDAENAVPAMSVFAAVKAVTHLREAGGGRWVTTVAQSVQGILEAVLQSVQAVKPLTLGRSHLLQLPCFAPALAAAPPTAGGTPNRTETITTADGVRIEFQQLPGSGNRVRVFVDTAHLPPPVPSPLADGEPEQNGVSASYNVAFLTLMEGGGNHASAAPLNHRHVLVISLNERGVGYADFTVSSGDFSGAGKEAVHKNVLPAPRTGGCSLVSATLSYLPHLTPTI